MDRDQRFLLPAECGTGYRLIIWCGSCWRRWRLWTVVFMGAKLGGVGRTVYDPDMLLALLIYAYAVG